MVLLSGQPAKGDDTQHTLQRCKETLHQSGVVLKQMFILELGDCVDFRVCARGSLEGL